MKFHINAGLNIGLSETEIKEIIILMCVYAGFTAALNGTAILKKVIKERNVK
jgi:4-carboxymuconolactone decarboxylase